MIEYIEFGLWLTGLIVFVLGWITGLIVFILGFMMIWWKLIDYILRQTGLMVQFLQAMRRMYQEKRDKETING
jgi:ABC-type multidrug transport system permease subunit